MALKYWLTWTKAIFKDSRKTTNTSTFCGVWEKYFTVLTTCDEAMKDVLSNQDSLVEHKIVFIICNRHSLVLSSWLPINVKNCYSSHDDHTNSVVHLYCWFIDDHARLYYILNFKLPFYPQYLSQRSSLLDKWGYVGFTREVSSYLIFITFTQSCMAHPKVL
jgi:hypothetical protein